MGLRVLRRNGELGELLEQADVLVQHGVLGDGEGVFDVYDYLSLEGDSVDHDDYANGDGSVRELGAVKQ
jgi:hypothetical protein